MLESTERTIKNEQSRDTVNIGDKKTHTQYNMTRQPSWNPNLKWIVNIRLGIIITQQNMNKRSITHAIIKRILECIFNISVVKIKVEIL